MTRLFVGVALIALLHACGPAGDVDTNDNRRELVVVVHGMGRTPLSMLPLAGALENAGYDVMNWGYSSTCCTVGELGQQLLADLHARDGKRHWTRVHFVGHSLGTVIIRWVLAHDSIAQHTGRVVMIAPPNRGSHEADRTAEHLGRIFRPLPELRTTPGSTARRLVVPKHIQVGVIAGKYDGKVSVAETHLEGEAGHIVVPAAHSFMMLRSDVKALTIRFLRTGSFQPASQLR